MDNFEDAQDVIDSLNKYIYEENLVTNINPDITERKVLIKVFKREEMTLAEAVAYEICCWVGEDGWDDEKKEWEELSVKERYSEIAYKVLDLVKQAIRIGGET